MQIKNVKITPFEEALEPELLIECEVQMTEWDIPIGWNGRLYSGNKRIGILYEYSNGQDNIREFTPRNAPNAKGSLIESKTFRFTSELSKVALNHIESTRDQKGDVHLQVRLTIRYLVPDFKLLDTSLDGRKKETLIEIDGYRFMHQQSHFQNKAERIAGTDWIHDFIPAFNQQKYQVFEIPQPEMLNAEIEVKKKLKEAINALPHMEEARSKGEWNRVIKESRPIWELVNNKEDLENTFKGELNDETWGSLKDLIQSFFTFSSKFIHRMNRDKELMEVNNAAKEDAELVYAMAFSIVNFIGRKLETSEQELRQLFAYGQYFSWGTSQVFWSILPSIRQAYFVEFNVKAKL